MAIRFDWAPIGLAANRFRVIEGATPCAAGPYIKRLLAALGPPRLVALLLAQRETGAVGSREGHGRPEQARYGEQHCHMVELGAPEFGWLRRKNGWGRRSVAGSSRGRPSP